MDFYIPVSVIEQQVLHLMASLGIAPVSSSSLIIDGHIHRYQVDGDRAGEKSGAYCIYPDGLPAGFVQSWRHGIEQKFKFDSSSLSDEHKHFLASKDFQKKSLEQQNLRKKQEDKQRAIKSEEARVRFEQMKSAPDDHPYLVRKHVANYGLNIQNNSLVIPLYDIDRRFRSFQWIDSEGNKTFFPGAPMSGSFFSVALDIPGDDPILLGEGYATMATIYELTGLPVVAAMNCHNLIAVAASLRQKFPQRNIIVMADNDAKTAGNPGLTKAQEAVQKFKLSGLVYPPFKSPDEGTDWNDFANLYGQEPTENFLKEQIHWACLTKEQQEEFLANRQLHSISTKLDRYIQIPPEEFIGGIFPRKRISAVVAASGTGKTWFLQKFVSDLSIGGPILDGLAEEEKPLRSLIFAGEAGPSLMIRRAADTKWAANKDLINIIGMVDAEKKGVSVMLDEEEGRKNIERLINMYKPDGVYFDTLSSFHNSDENKAAEMKPIFRWLLTLAEVNNIAVVLMHHSRKRLAKERKLALTQDDVIGSSIFNRLVGVIISIEPTEEDNKTLLVKVLKSWFAEFMPFTYKMAEGPDERTVMQIDLAPESMNSSKAELWSFIQKTYSPGQWFKASDLSKENIGGDISSRQVRRLLADLVNTKKLKRRGINKYVEYSVIGFYSDGE